LTDAWARDLFNRLLPLSDGIMLEFCSEWCDARNKECDSKAARWCEMAKEWPGLKAWNKGSRPGSAPSGHILDWHVNRVEQLGPRGAHLVKTDTGNVLNWLGGLGNNWGNLARLTQLVKATKAQGHGFAAYFWGPTIPLDQAAIDAIGKAWNE
jgi:hypothetical protein